MDFLHNNCKPRKSVKIEDFDATKTKLCQL